MTGLFIKKPSDLMYSNRELRNLFIPLLIELALAFSVGLADSMMVAQVSEDAVSGVSLVDFIMALFINVFSAVAGGGAVVVGQYYGMKDFKDAQHSARQLVRCVLALSLGITVAVYALREPIFRVLFGSITPEVRNAADIYFTIVIASIPSLALYNCGAAVFRTMGNARLPMLSMFSMNVLNVVGNAFLVFVLGWGVEGIAIPTFIARTGAAVIVLTLARKKSLDIHIRGWLTAKNDYKMMRRILGIGAPFGFENGMFYLGRLAVLSIVAKFGTAAIAANAVAGSISIFQTLPGAAINLGLSVVIARCIGARDKEQARYYAKKIIGMIHVAFLCSCAVVALAMPLLMRIYSLSPEAEYMVWWVIITHGAFQILIWPEAFSLPVVFRGAGDAKYPMVVAILIMIFARIIAAWFLSVTFGLGMLGTWWAMYIDWAARLCFFIPHYLRGGWLEHRAI